MDVDAVVERGSEVAGVEVKAAATVTPSDSRGLRKLQRAAPGRFACGVVLYDGEVTAGFRDGRFAVPVRALCEGQPAGLGPGVTAQPEMLLSR